MLCFLFWCYIVLSFEKISFPKYLKISRQEYFFVSRFSAWFSWWLHNSCISDRLNVNQLPAFPILQVLTAFLLSLFYCLLYQLFYLRMILFHQLRFTLSDLFRAYLHSLSALCSSLNSITLFIFWMLDKGYYTLIFFNTPKFWNSRIDVKWFIWNIP